MKATMSTSIIEIYEQSNYSDYFIILAYVCDNCNYHCYYCYNKFPRLHINIDLNKLLELCIYVHNITNKHIKLELIGGEPTLHPDLISFCENISKLSFITCFILTNLTQSLHYYKLLFNYNVNIIATWHSLSTDLYNNEFICKVQKISECFPLNQFQLRIMIENKNFNNSLYISNMFINTKLNNNMECQLLSINEYNKQLYTIDQLNKYQDLINKIKCYDKQYHVKYDNNTIDILYFNDIYLNTNFSFKHWLCNAGQDYLYIHVDGNIYPCETYYYDIPLSHINNIYNLKYLQLKKTLCKCQYCTSCDFGIYKKRIFNI